MTDKILTEKQAYLAMYLFLENYYEITKSGEIGAMLGSMSLLQDGGTADPAIAQEWSEAVRKVKEGQADAMLHLKQIRDRQQIGTTDSWVPSPART